MTINWEVVMWTGITVVVMVGILVLAYYIISARAMKKRRTVIVDMNEAMKPGATVMFAGILGKIVKVNDEYLDVEVAKGTVITISRYAVTDVVKK